MDTISARTFEQKILFAGTQANYDALANKSASALYFTTDTKKLFKGSDDFSAAVRVVSTLPSSGAANNVLYVVNDGGFKSAAYTVNGGTNWTTIAFEKIDAIDDVSTSPTYNGDSTVSVPSTKAVVDYVTSKVGTSGAITSIAKNASSAAVIDYATNGATAATGNIEVGGVATVPTWDAATETLTIPYTGFGATSAGQVQVNFGKYSLVKEASYNPTTEKIDFWLEGSDPSTDEPDFSVDVSSLVTEIDVDDTNSVDLDLSVATAGPKNHVITANVNVATKTGVTNYLSVIAGGEGQTKGLLVDLTTIEDSLNNLNTSITNLESALTTWGVIPAPAEP